MEKAMDETLLNQRKETVLALVRDPQYRPMKIKELAILLQVPREQREDLQLVLDELIAEGKLGLSKRGKYGLPQEQLFSGIFQAASGGYGFVAVEGRDEDIYVPETQVGTAMHGDEVQVALTGAGRRLEGKIVKILSRAVTEVVGTYHPHRSYGFVVPDQTRLHWDIFIPAGKEGGAVDGHKVVARLTRYGDRGHNPEGEVTEILGHCNDPGVDITSVVRAYGLPDAFSDEVMAEAQAVDGAASDGADRLDLRDWQLVTIDGEDAKDLDDAVSVQRRGDGYLLGVHIADVSQYVREGSAMDAEARRRGTSVYLADRVIPMLPHRLSNGICSLNAGEDRLALSCLMEFDREGSLVGHRLAETRIRVCRRMSYTEVQKILDGEAEACRRHEELAPLFLCMQELAQKLRRRRRRRGSVDFDLPESKLVLDERGKPLKILPYPRNQATELIEDFMLAANETVAEEYYWQELPFVYRTHENPDPDKLRELAALLRPYVRLHLGQGELHPKELQRALAEVADTPEAAFLSRLALRSMKQARYQTECTGHFGLAAKYYCHFTSPIRRYPDLQIHRIIKENLRGRLDDERQEHYAGLLGAVAAESSRAERRAKEAERAVTKLKMAEYMYPRVGERFDGIISGVTRWGFYVELPSTVEGLVHVNSLVGDYYRLDEGRHELVGEHTGRRFRLGQAVSVRLLGVDLAAHTIDFALAASAAL